MKTKVYELVLYKNGETEKITLSSYSLSKFIDDFKDSDYEFVFIKKNLKHQIERKEEKDNKLNDEKLIYYKAKYSQLYKQHRANKISLQEFKDSLKELKNLKENSKNKEIMKKEFEAYKKANKIPPYNVSSK